MHLGIYLTSNNLFQVAPKVHNYITGQVQECPLLSAFVTNRSWLFFSLVGSEAMWLHDAPQDWPQNPDYQRLENIATHMLVVNDCAERNVKAITEYVHLTRNNMFLDQIILVGEDRRSLVPSLHRENLLNA